MLSVGKVSWPTGFLCSFLHFLFVAPHAIFSPSLFNLFMYSLKIKLSAEVFGFSSPSQGNPDDVIIRVRCHSPHDFIGIILADLTLFLQSHIRQHLFSLAEEFSPWHVNWPLSAQSLTFPLTKGLLQTGQSTLHSWDHLASLETLKIRLTFIKNSSAQRLNFWGLWWLKGFKSVSKQQSHAHMYTESFTDLGI